jgi:PiT family inorganic phosphate transporter
MFDSSFVLFVLVILVALAFGYVNGWTDAPNAIATVVSTRVLSPRAAVTMAAILNLAGALTGTAVAYTIGKGVVETGALTQGTVIAGVGAVIIWSTLAWYYGLPTSESHGLVAALIGAGIATAGSHVVHWSVLYRVLMGLVNAPILGFVGGFFAMFSLLWILRRSLPSTVQNVFGKLQIVSAAFMAYAHGKNDGQMPMGIIMMALIVRYGWTEFHVPLWVMVISALSIAVGTATGGWRIIRTIGMRVTKLQPVHGFAAETSAAAVVEAASQLGIPVSTTHCIGSSIMGVGATRRLSAVRWGVAGDILVAWILTYPVCAGLGWVLSKLLGMVI